MSRGADFGARLYSGEQQFNIVGRRRLWYSISAVLLVLSAIGIFGRGLNLGIEFAGGAEFVVPANSCSIQEVRDSVSATGTQVAQATELGGDRVRVQTPAMDAAKSAEVVKGLSKTCDVAADDIRVQLVGPSWGQEITKKALVGLGVFLLAVTLFLSLYFEWKMALAALVALIHDLVITIGIYALVGFEVTPATVIGVLTILGYSLYDTVVVFDKVKENTRNITGQSKMTYSEAANLAVNQSLIRSLNTSVVGLLPVAAVLFVGVGLLGAGTLKDLALALFVGIATGAYSSIFIATPFLCQLKEREPAIQALDQRVMARRQAAAARPGASTATATGTSTATAGGTPSGTAGADAAAAETNDAAVASDSASSPGQGGAGQVDSTAASALSGERPERPHRQRGPRNQPKNVPRSKR